MKYKLILLIALCIGGLSYAQELYAKNHQERFIRKYESQYRRDSSLRPTDTLVYFPTIMNLVENKRYKRLPVAEQKRSFFQLICSEPLKIVYPSAFDLVNKVHFNNPRGDLDYWYHERNKVFLHKSDMSLFHPNRASFINALIEYVNQEHPDFIFTISNVVYEAGVLFWAIKGDEVYAIVYTEKDDTITEYKAEDYIMRFAPDSVFSSSLRLSE